MSDSTIRFAAVPSPERERFDVAMEERNWTFSFVDDAEMLVDSTESQRDLIDDPEVPPRFTLHSAPDSFPAPPRRVDRPVRRQAAPPQHDCPSLNRLLTSYGRLRGSESGDASGDDPDGEFSLQYLSPKRPAGCPAFSGRADHAGLLRTQTTSFDPLIS